jgi:hypothetical protein
MGRDEISMIELLPLTQLQLSFWKMPITITIIVLAIFIKCFFGVISGIE